MATPRERERHLPLTSRWPKFPADVSTSDAGLGCTYILNDLQIDFCGGSITEVATRRLFFGYLTAYQA